MNFSGDYYKIYACFEQKTAFVMQNFRNLGLVGIGVTIFWQNPQKAHPWLISRVLSLYACKSVPGFSCRHDHEEKGHYKKSQRGYISPICQEFLTQPNLTKIGIWVEVANVINRTKFGNDQPRQHKVTEGQILACSIGMACHLLHCSTTVLHVTALLGFTK